MTQSPDAPADRIQSFVRAFSDILRLPRAFWIVILAFVLESMAYFGALTLMTSYLTRDLGWSDATASPTVSIFTMLVTLFMLGAGSYAESFGLRKAILGALLLCVAGRVLYAWIGTGAVPGEVGSGASVVTLILAALVVIALGEAVLQPVCYSGIKQYTDERTSAMGYGLIYAVMNAGIVVMGEVSARFRPAVQNIIDGQASGQSGVLDSAARGLAASTASGIQAINWVVAGLSGLTFVIFLVLMTRKAEAAKLRPDTAEEQRLTETRPLGARLKAYFTDGPFKNSRFIFFIFMLLPVRTLFAHQWLTMPEYILRSFDRDVADNMERLVNWINPAIIFFGVPIATALTRKVNVYKMMIIGSLVSAVPTFLLCSGPNLTLLITYFVLFSVGEALWSARFLEYASELAPPGRIAQYMGLANIPWLLAKGTTGFYAGWLLGTYCPENVPPTELHTETLWFIYGCIAMVSPIGLWLARKWVMKGLLGKPVDAPATA